jgi:N-acetylated-alpha-linked acidic dipeptidase
MTEVLRDVSEPGGSRSLLDAARARRRPGAGNAPAEFHLGPLGSGSDYVAFIDHAGVASVNLGFEALNGGVYHSIYDTMGWFERFSDGDLSHGRTLTQVMTTSILRLADAPVLPVEFDALTRTIHGYIDDIQKEAQKHSGNVNFMGVQTQLSRLETASRAYNEQLSASLKQTPVPEKLVKANEVLAHAERALLLDSGLPGRDWYRHQLYAPGLYTGYDAKTIPGVREAAEAQRWAEANQQARRLAQVLRALASQVEEATSALKQALEP